MALSKDDLRRLGEVMRQTTNSIGLDDFDGYSPDEMREIIYNPLSDRCPVQLTKSDVDLYQQIPILNQVRYLLSIIAKAGKIKLTITGKLPVSLVADIYAQGFIKDRLIETGIHKLYKEEDALSIHLAHILLHLTRTVRKSKGFLSLTKKGILLLNKPGTLLKELLLAFGQKFNWSYFDGFGPQPIGSIGWLYSIYLVATYGHTPRSANFYAEKYFTAFPALMKVPDTGDPFDCYVIRSFNRFMVLFGLVNILRQNEWELTQEIDANPDIKMLFDITLPKNHQEGRLN